ncbi:MAG: hypothetical protein BM565_02185 [Gammaproteobacteria bacterium MedPE]|nr:MAG: hypothetical protein BM565_02185 [Gammaproteobacteria bacterium MedPE]
MKTKLLFCVVILISPVSTGGGVGVGAGLGVGLGVGGGVGVGSGLEPPLHPASIALVPTITTPEE